MSFGYNILTSTFKAAFLSLELPLKFFKTFQNVSVKLWNLIIMTVKYSFEPWMLDAFIGC